MTAPIALELMEDAIHAWVTASTGLPATSVYFPEPEASGAPEPAYPHAQISMIGVPQSIGQPEIRRITAEVIQRVTVIAAGPGQVGVDFYLSFAEVPQVIAYTAAPAETPASSAAGLLGQLTADLPAGVTAIIDPADSTSVQILGSPAEPLFAAAPTDPALTLVTPLRERWGELECVWSRIVWRVTTRTSDVRGFGTAFDLSTRALGAMKRRLQPTLMSTTGWKPVEVLVHAGQIADDLSESNAILDFALEGYATSAYQDPALRLVDPQLQATG